MLMVTRFDSRLNEDSKVLSPEELLFRCVEAVNFTHNPKSAQMDIKLRFEITIFHRIC